MDMSDFSNQEAKKLNISIDMITEYDLFSISSLVGHF